MNDETMDDDERSLDAEAIAAYDVPGPSEAVEARLFATQRAASMSRVRRWPIAVVAVVVAAAAALILAVRRPAAHPEHGSLASEVPRPFSIGARASGFAEPGARLAWSLAPSGEAAIEQANGTVHYQVRPGAPFVVATPVGRVAVTGTNFRVEVGKMSQRIKAGAVGALIGAFAVVVVYEGAVRVSSDARAGGEIEVRAGQTARVEAGEPPVVGDAPVTGAAVARGVAQGAESAEVTRLRAQVIELSTRDAEQASRKVSVSSSNEWWAAQPRDPAWAPARERALADRLRDYVGLSPDETKLECRSRCCRLRLSSELFDEYQNELLSSVGLGDMPYDGYATSVGGSDESIITACWNPSTSASGRPDRGRERDVLLAGLAGELEACEREATHGVILRLSLELDPDGKVVDVDSNNPELGDPAASCAERAILDAARFAPSPDGRPSFVPFRVQLGAR